MGQLGQAPESLLRNLDTQEKPDFGFKLDGDGNLNSVSINGIDYTNVELYEEWNARYFEYGQKYIFIRNNFGEDAGKISGQDLKYYKPEKPTDGLFPEGIYIGDQLPKEIIKLLKTSEPTINEMDPVGGMDMVLAKIDKNKIAFFREEQFADDFKFIVDNWMKISDSQAQEFKEAIKVYIQEVDVYTGSDIWLPDNFKLLPISQSTFLVLNPDGTTLTEGIGGYKDLRVQHPHVK